MAEEKSKKPKIDLKARLGKTAAGVPAPTPSMPGTRPSDPGGPLQVPVASPSVDRISAPPSVRPSTGGIAPPVGIAPPPGLGAGMLNPFAPKPVAQPKAAPVSAEAQTIKVEVSEELNDERKKARRFAIIVGVLGAAVGLGIGFFAGGSRERQVRAANAIRGADKLELAVNDTAKKVDELEPIFKDIESSLKNKKYPTDQVAKLNDFTMPFNTATLKEANIGGLPADVQSKLLLFVRLSEEIQDKKKDLANMIGFAKPRFEEMWAKWAEKPGVEFVVTFTGGEGKVGGELWFVKYDDTPAKDGQPAKRQPRIQMDAKDFPTELQLKRTANATEAFKVARYAKGELPGANPQFVPIDPKTIPFNDDEPIHLPIMQKMAEIRMLVAGNDAVNFEKPGIRTEAEPLAAELSKISLAKQ